MSRAKSNNLTAILLIALLCLLGFCAYQWFQLRSVKQELSTSKTTLLENQKLQAELEADYQAALDNLEELRGTNSELNAQIDEQKRVLAQQKKKISGLIWTKGELGKAKEELEALRLSSANSARQIRELKEQNAGLLASNKQLNETKTALESSVAQKAEEIKGLTSEKAELLENKSKIEAENTTLADKVDIAEAIKINNIVVNGLKQKSNDKIKRTLRAKVISALEICLTTETNLVVGADEETFFIKIINPAGETLTHDVVGSGQITNKLDDSSVKYTTTSTFDYTNVSMDKCMVWEPNFSFTKGLHNVMVYNKGYLVGEGSFILK